MVVPIIKYLKDEKTWTITTADEVARIITVNHKVKLPIKELSNTVIKALIPKVIANFTTSIIQLNQGDHCSNIIHLTKFVQLWMRNNVYADPYKTFLS